MFGTRWENGCRFRCDWPYEPVLIDLFTFDLINVLLLFRNFFLYLSLSLRLPLHTQSKPI